MTRPKKGTPEYELWLCAIEVATYPPLQAQGATMQVGKRDIAALRDALDALGIDWREAKVKRDAEKADRARRQRAPRA